MAMAVSLALRMGMPCALAELVGMAADAATRAAKKVRFISACLDE
jgi:hypothetical protein